jgi:hypothetical protein
MTETDWLTSEDPQAMLQYVVKDRHPRSQGPSDRKLRLFACAAARMGGVPDEKNIHGAELWAEGGVPTEYRYSYQDPSAPKAASFVSQPYWAGAYGNINQADKASLIREIVGNPWRPVTPLWDRVKVGDEMLLESEPNYHLRKRRPGERPANAEVVEMLPGGKMRVQPAYGGNPGVWEVPDPTPLVPWLTPTVLSLAAAAYENRSGRWEPTPLRGVTTQKYVEDGSLDPVRLLVLADALLDAGCDNEQILRHLQGWEEADENTHSDNLIWVQKNRPHVRGCWVLDLLLGYS